MQLQSLQNVKKSEMIKEMVLKFVKFCLAGLPLLLGLTIAFVIFSGNLGSFGIPIPLNQAIRLDYVFAIATVVFGGILTIDFVGVVV